MRILDADEARGREMHIAAADGAADLGQLQPPLLVVGDGAQTQTAQGGGSPHFVVHDVRFVPQYHLVAALAMGEHRCQVALRAAGCEEGRLLAHYLRRHRLQAVYRRVVPEHVVSQRRLRDRFQHLRRRQSDSIAPEVNDLHGLIKRAPS